MFLDSKGVMLFERGGRHSHEVMVTGSGPGERVWAIVLAGGQGTRLKPLVERIHADGRPKQYAVLMGRRSLLRHTLDRAALAIPPDRIVVVTTKSHAAYFGSEFSEPGPAKVLVQPHDRGTAAGILLPVHWIAWRDPGATVVILPSDHFVADEEAFMRHIASLFSVAERHPDRILLVGATPESPESGYGWIQPGIELEKGPSGDIRTVDRFVEKPSPAEARACLARGGVWNTFVMVARASALIGKLLTVRPGVESGPARRVTASGRQLERLGDARARPRDAAPRGNRPGVADRRRESDAGHPEARERRGIPLVGDATTRRASGLAQAMAAKSRSTSSARHSAVPGFITDAAAAATP